MALTILQVNIRCWTNNRYLLSVDLCNYPPDVILLNETSATNNNIKLQGFTTIQKCEERFSGVAILVKNTLQFTSIPLPENNTLAIKLFTSIGPIIISTSYVPPRQNSIPTISLNKILNFNLPTVFISDFNAKNPMFHNTTYRQVYGDARGTQLAALATARNLDFLGPYFYTYQSGRNRGTPDIILSNNQFRFFHHLITQGNHIGSDHVPIILKISLQPIKTVQSNNLNLNTLDIPKFKQQLCNDTFDDLDNKPVTVLDDVVQTIFSNITNATDSNCQHITIKPHQSYIPTPQIRLKLRQLQAANTSHFSLGYPSNVVLNNYKTQLLNLISLHKSKQWKLLVKLASDYWGKPDKFWKSIHKLQGGKFKTSSHLIDSNNVEILDSQNKANLMSTSWENIFKPHNDAQFNNDNTRMIDQWFTVNENTFQHDAIINMSNLIEDHILLRPITNVELRHSITNTSNRAPGPSGIKSITIKNLPPNYFHIILSLFNAIIASKYWPLLFKISRMVFAPKQGKTPTNPLNYRPISLLEILAKMFERILMNRLLLHLEFNNLIPPSQFGFRPGRSTQQSIHSIRESIKESRSQGKSVLVATRDISKAFDSVWLQGLLYKIQVLLQINVHFTALTYNYIFNRIISPTFDSKTGPSFTPLSGVPQGSCLGPILFLIYVHDIPLPAYRDTLVVQFADDVVHVIRSSSNGPNRARSAKNKIQRELCRTLRWEIDWKIKTCWEKCKVGFAGTSMNALRNLGGIVVQDQQVEISQEVKILGFTFTNYLSANPHVTSIVNKAKYNLKLLYRFQSAPPKIKLYLYSALIRSVLDYPSIELFKTTKSNLLKLQRIQNKALRFVYNITLNDRISSISLHQRAKIDPINVRLAKLARKQLYKMKELFDPNADSDVAPFMKLAIDYIPSGDPLRPQLPSIHHRIKNVIFSPGYDRYPAISLLPEDGEQFIIPPPIFR